MEDVYALLIMLGVLIISVAIFIHFVPLMLWISAIAAGVNVSLFTMVGMRLRRIAPEKIINPLIKAVKAGLDVNIDQLETHYLSGGNVARVVDALIIARESGVDLSFEEAIAFDLEVKGEEIDLAQIRKKSG